MKKTKYIILGAGPSGLAFAHTLLAAGERDFVVLEKEGEAGGLCRSATVDAAPLDMGGGHFLDVKRSDVLNLLFSFLPEHEWNRFKRDSRISLAGDEVAYPLEANVWQLPVERQVEYIESAALAGATQGHPMPEEFSAWIHWKLGQAIARDYMIPYNSKIWSMDLNALGTYWLHKLPNVSFTEMLRSCLERKPYGALPAHGEFLYPKRFGYGEVWRRMGNALGERLLLGEELRSINLESRVVNGRFQARTIVNSVPWAVWQGKCDLPSDVFAAIRQLVWVPIDVEYIAQNLPSPAHWIYYPEPSLRHHRSLLRHNFVPGARGYWTESNGRRQRNQDQGITFSNEYAYPVNTKHKPLAVEAIVRWARSRDILPIGRWGIWEHMNSDVAVSLAISAAMEALSQ